MSSEPNHAPKELSPRQLHPAVATFQQFMLTSISSSKLLLLATIVALIWANSPWAAQYFGLWNTELGISIGSEYKNGPWGSAGFVWRSFAFCSADNAWPTFAKAVA